MKDRNRVVIALVIIIGVALVLCGGMCIGGALVYGVLQFDNGLSSQNTPETAVQQLEKSEVEQLLSELQSGVVIAEVVPGSPAEEAGLEVGDLILAVDGQEIGPDGNLAALIAQYEPGDRVTLQVQVQDDRETRTVRVTLGEDTAAPGRPYLGVGYHPAVLHGLDLDEMLPFGEQDDLPMPEILDGAHIMVVSVTEGSPADDAGLQHGDLITALDGESFESAEALVEAIASREPGDTVTLSVLHVADEAAVDVQVRLAEHPNRAGVAYLGITVRDIVRFRRFQGRPFQPAVTPEPPPP